MKIVKCGYGSMTKVLADNGEVFYYSYATLVAYTTIEGVTYITATKYSVTTSKQIGKYVPYGEYADNDTLKAAARNAGVSDYMRPY